jgi:hypothetical protein
MIKKKKLTSYHSEQRASIEDSFKLFVQGDLSQLNQNIQNDSLSIFGDITVIWGSN